jgi:carbon monoxide dehydrogenase subunit G
VRVERNITIARPPGEVFAHISDVRNNPSSHTDVLEVRSSTDDVRVGTVFDVRVKPSMGISKGTMTVSRLEPGRLVEFRGDMSGRMRPTVTNICGPDGAGTRVTRRVELEPPGLMRVMSPLIARTIGKSNERFLANLKLLMDSPPATSDT